MSKIAYLKTSMIKILENEYINTFVTTRQKERSIDNSFIMSDMHLQEFVIDFMGNNPNEIKDILNAYNDLRQNKKAIREKSLIAYDLTLCSDDIRAKYTQLVLG